jgi:hypothetical protein
MELVEGGNMRALMMLLMMLGRGRGRGTGSTATGRTFHPFDIDEELQ